MNTNRLLGVTLITAFSLTMACGDSNPVPLEIENTMDSGLESQCSYNGKVYQTGDIFCAMDGCNSCQCNPEGTRKVSCSMVNCSAPGVTIPEICMKSQPTPGTCTYNGTEYHTGDTFCADDGCNTCECNPDGVTCTKNDCENEGTYNGVCCPTQAPNPDDPSQCDRPKTLQCDYFYQETQCDYMDLYWHCSCKDGKWACWHDLEDCIRGDAGI